MQVQEPQEVQVQVQVQEPPEAQVQEAPGAAQGPPEPPARSPARLWPVNTESSLWDSVLTGQRTKRRNYLGVGLQLLVATLGFLVFGFGLLDILSRPLQQGLQFGEVLHLVCKLGVLQESD